jgi:hypothetical protein
MSMAEQPAAPSAANQPRTSRAFLRQLHDDMLARIAELETEYLLKESK